VINTITKIFIKDFAESGNNLASKDASFFITGILLPAVSNVNI
jgi:hypothetical protein